MRKGRLEGDGKGLIKLLAPSHFLSSSLHLRGTAVCQMSHEERSYRVPLLLMLGCFLSIKAPKLQTLQFGSFVFPVRWRSANVKHLHLCTCRQDGMYQKSNFPQPVSSEHVYTSALSRALLYTFWKGWGLHKMELQVLIVFLNSVEIIGILEIWVHFNNTSLN